MHDIEVAIHPQNWIGSTKAKLKPETKQFSENIVDHITDIRFSPSHVTRHPLHISVFTCCKIRQLQYQLSMSQLSQQYTMSIHALTQATNNLKCTHLLLITLPAERRRVLYSMKFLSCRRSRRILYCFSFFFFFLLLLLLLLSSSSFCQHRYFSYNLHGITMWLRYIHELADRYKTYGSRNSPGVIWGHRGQKG